MRRTELTVGIRGLHSADLAMWQQFADAELWVQGEDLIFRQIPFRIDSGATSSRICVTDATNYRLPIDIATPEISR